MTALVLGIARTLGSRRCTVSSIYFPRGNAADSPRGLAGGSVSSWGFSDCPPRWPSAPFCTACLRCSGWSRCIASCCCSPGRRWRRWSASGNRRAGCRKWWVSTIAPGPVRPLSGISPVANYMMRSGWAQCSGCRRQFSSRNFSYCSGWKSSTTASWRTHRSRCRKRRILRKTPG